MIKPPFPSIALFMILSCCRLSAAADTIMVGHFSSLYPELRIPALWQPLTFDKIERHTVYSAVKIENRTAIEASSIAGASGLFRNLKFDPGNYPWLVWQWRVERMIENADVTTRRGDDCAARIYVAFEFVKEGKTKWERFKHQAASVIAGRELPGSALTYIWGNKTPPGTILDSPYTRQSKIVVVKSGKAFLSQWTTEKRHLIKDYRAAFGAEPPAIVGIGIMTDTDNTGGSTTAYYGDIRLLCDSP